MNDGKARPGLAVFLLVVCLCHPSLAALDDATAQWFQVVLDRWRDACRNDLRTAEGPLPWMIFYDEAHAWHINPDRKLLPAHRKLPARLRFFGRKYDVFEVAHQNKIWTPGREPLAVKTRAVTMLYANETKPFLLMSTPAFQQRASRVTDTQDLRNFLAGLALHELAHTRQLPQIMAQIRQLQGQYRYPDSIDDNMIQTAFEGNAEYRSMHQQELAQLSAAILAGDAAEGRARAREAVRMMSRRRERFFVGEYQGWSEMEDVFLALEGSAMWVQFQAAVRMAPKGQPWLETLGILSQRTDAWTQSEGLGLFFLIDRFVRQWQAKSFGGEILAPIEMLRRTFAPPPQ